jgi:hypothetical protein
VALKRVSAGSASAGIDQRRAQAEGDCARVFTPLDGLDNGFGTIQGITGIDSGKGAHHHLLGGKACHECARCLPSAKAKRGKDRSNGGAYTTEVGIALRLHPQRQIQQQPKHHGHQENDRARAAQELARALTDVNQGALE